MGATGLDYNAVYKIAESIGIEVDEIMLRQLRAVEDMTLTEIHKETKVASKS